MSDKREKKSKEKEISEKQPPLELHSESSSSSSDQKDQAPPRRRQGKKEREEENHRSSDSEEEERVEKPIKKSRKPKQATEKGATRRRRKPRTTGNEQPKDDGEPKDDAGKRERLAKSRLGKSGRNDLKKSWKEEDLEIIVPVDSESDSGSDTEENEIVSDPNGVNYIDELPDELILNIYEFRTSRFYLDEKQVGKASQVCHRWNLLSCEEEIWIEKAKKWNYVASANVKKAKNKSDFVKLYQHQTETAANTARTLEIALRRKKKQEAGDTTEFFLRLFLYNRVVDFITPIMVILGTIFITIRLEGVVDWSWRTVLIPFYFPLFQAAIAIPAYDLSHETFGNMVYWESDVSWWAMAFTKRRPWRGIVYSSIVCLLIFFILLIIRLNPAVNDVGIPAVVVVVPLLVWSVLVGQAMFTGCCSEDSLGDSDGPIDRFTYLLFLVLFFIQLLFVGLKVDFNFPWEWYLVLIPFWIFCCLFVCLPCTYIVCSWCCSCWKRNCYLMDNFGRWELFFFSAGCWLVLAPIFALILLIAQNLEGDAPERPWRVILIPAYILEIVFLAGCFIPS